MKKRFTIKSLILFLLLSQFVTLVHAIEHQLVVDDHEACLVCVHANDNNNTLTNTPVSTGLDISSVEETLFEQIKYDLKTLTLQSIRSPPIHP